MQTINWNKAAIRKVSVRLDGHATSFSLEQPFLDILKTMAQNRKIAFARLVAQIDESRPAHINLSSALRLAVLESLTKHIASPAVNH
ncbi:MAG: Putative DNA-binding protein [Candidatus Tokpelaia hoelldobleri]|uniref:DNA-binding protein n=1 Tax=Candidatus Tokpelaia hoelldobleri TaxID=1902579 RepID=A0A1U9JVU6_9HYPH|nr:MAG: Putative DNA-binding protein [Candidatus Tokpelaia hoelldoblerii]